MTDSEQSSVAAILPPAKRFRLYGPYANEADWPDDAPAYPDTWDAEPRHYIFLARTFTSVSARLFLDSSDRAISRGQLEKVMEATRRAVQNGTLRLFYMLGEVYRPVARDRFRLGAGGSSEWADCFFTCQLRYEGAGVSAHFASQYPIFAERQSLDAFLASLRRENVPGSLSIDLNKGEYISVAATHAHKGEAPMAQIAWLPPEPINFERPPKKRGPAPKIKLRVRKEMKADINESRLSVSELTEMPEKDLVVRYGVKSRTTAREARQDVLREHDGVAD